MLAIPLSGKLSHGIEPGSYMLIFNSPNYEEKRLKVSIEPGETKKIYADLARMRKVPVIEKEEKEEVIVKDVKEEIEDIQIKFAFKEISISPHFYGDLDRIAEILKVHNDIGLMIIGHTDSIGPYSHNQILSEERALAVKMYLVDKGIASERLIPGGYGETRPMADNRNEEGREKNRRVEFTIFKLD
jgi:outer membrane protein OmpA-like peptidoglycan-associated protein